MQFGRQIHTQSPTIQIMAHRLQQKFKMWFMVHNSQLFQAQHSQELDILLQVGAQAKQLWRVIIDKHQQSTHTQQQATQHCMQFGQQTEFKLFCQQSMEISILIRIRSATIQFGLNIIPKIYTQVKLEVQRVFLEPEEMVTTSSVGSHLQQAEHNIFLQQEV